MTRKPNSSLTPAGLRRRAEARLRQRRDRQKSRTQETRSTADTRRLPHELQVHQVELEMQNAELQEARNQIEAQLEKYTDLYDFAPVGYCSLDEQGRILEVNLTGAALLGVERSRLTHQRLPRFVAPVSQPLFLAFLKKLFAGPDAQACEALLLKERVGTFWAGFRGTSAVSVGATRKSSRISFVDITARKQGEEALRASEERFRALFELGPVAVYSCDAAGTIQDFNRRAAELWGREPAFGDTDERFCGSFKLFRPDGNPLPHGQCPMAQVLDGKIAEVRDAEVLIERPDGSRVSVVVNIRPLGYKLGKITGAINCFFDITERKRAESAHRRIEVLAASNQLLEGEIARRQTVEECLRQSEQQQRQLLDQSRHMQEQLRLLSRQLLSAQEEERKRISRELHDVIAQTLTSINVRLAVLRKQAGANPRGLDRTIARTQRLIARSVNTVHRFARELRPTMLDDLGLLPALHTFLKSFQEQTGIRVSMSAFAALEQVNGDKRTVLYRVVQEALANVARHAQASRAEVHIQKLDAAVRLKIKDNGKGFTEAPVRRAKKNTRLGLLGMRERVEMVNGNFTIESTPGKGTTICALIPLGNGGPLSASIERGS